MADLEWFDLATVEDVSFEPIPPGEYLAALIDSESRPNSKGTGELLKLRFEILSGPYRGRLVFDNLNVRNENETAQRISLSRLKDLCLACGVTKPKASTDLHDIPVIIKVKTEQRSDAGEAQNRIVAYKPKSEAAGAAPDGASGAPPWKR